MELKNLVLIFLKFTYDFRWNILVGHFIRIYLPALMEHDKDNILMFPKWVL